MFVDKHLREILDTYGIEIRCRTTSPEDPQLFEVLKGRRVVFMGGHLEFNAFMQGLTFLPVEKEVPPSPSSDNTVRLEDVKTLEELQ